MRTKTGLLYSEMNQDRAELEKALMALCKDIRSEMYRLAYLVLIQEHITQGDLLRVRSLLNVQDELSMQWMRMTRDEALVAYVRFFRREVERTLALVVIDSAGQEEGQ